MGIVKAIGSMDPNSVRTKLLRRRFKLFCVATSDLASPVKVLDVGGVERFWEIMGACNNPRFEITILNLFKMKPEHTNIKTVVGDARDLTGFATGEFDVTFSNSVIEHLYTYREQMQMAEGIKKIGRRYFLQTPNYDFPFEPHFMVPFFQYFPKAIRVSMTQHLRLGWFPKAPNKKEAETIVDSVRLMRRCELQAMFPNDIIRVERFLGMPYSLIVCSEITQ